MSNVFTVPLGVRLFDELVETFDLERPDEVARLVEYMNFHSRNRRYQLKKGRFIGQVL